MVIKIDLHKQDIKLVSSSLGDRYWDYKKIMDMHNAWYITNAGKGYHLIPGSKGQDCIHKLTHCGFQVDVSQEAVKFLTRVVDEHKVHTDITMEKVSQHNKRLKPLGLAIRQYQIEDIVSLNRRRKSFLCNPVGTGKTMTALFAVPDNYATIIICPAGARDVWKSEILKWGLATEKQIELVAGTPKSWEKPRKKFTIYSSGSLPPAGAYVLGALQRNLAVIVDEAHQYINPRAQRTERARHVLEQASNQDGLIMGLTASPILNRYEELFHLLDTFQLVKQTFGSRDGFNTEYRGSKGQFGMTYLGPINPAQSERILQSVMIMRKREDIVSQMPDYNHRTVNIHLTRPVLKQVSDEIGNEDIEALISAGLNNDRSPAFDILSRCRTLLSQAKAKGLVEVVRPYLEAGEPLVVMSCSRTALDLLKGFLNHPKVAMISGQVLPEKREQIRQGFFSGKYTVLLCTIGSCYQSIDLTKASNMVFLDQDFRPEINLQCRGRIDRLSQKNKSLTYINAVSNHSLDMRLGEILAEKETMTKRVFNR